MKIAIVNMPLYSGIIPKESELEQTLPRLIHTAPNHIEVTQFKLGEFRTDQDGYIVLNIRAANRRVMEFLCQRGYIWLADKELIFCPQERRQREIGYLRRARQVIAQSPEHRLRILASYIETPFSSVVCPLSISLSGVKYHSDSEGQAITFVERDSWNELDPAIQWAAEIETYLDAYIADLPIDIYAAIASGEWHRVFGVETFSPKILEGYSKFVWFPEDFTPFGIPAVYALMCGLEVVGNINIGALSYGMDKTEMRKLIKEAPEKFWKIVEGAFSG